MDEVKTIFCADCRHCKVFRKYESTGGGYTLKVRCKKGFWRHSSGVEKIYDFHTVLSRRIEKCRHYETMSDGYADRRLFLKQLRYELNTKDIVQVADKPEVECHAQK